MREIEVLSVSPMRRRMESPSSGATASRSPTPPNDFDDGDLVLRVEPRPDGTPLVVDVRSLTAALAKVDPVLAVY